MDHRMNLMKRAPRRILAQILGQILGPELGRILGRSLAACFAIIIGMTSPGSANDTRPYDQDLLRLSEILGSLHYLRAVCDAKDGQLWREQMQAVLDAEGSSALRRVVLTRQFNRGFTNYSRTYRQCTTAAKTAIDRFLGEAETLSQRLLQDGPLARAGTPPGAAQP